MSADDLQRTILMHADRGVALELTCRACGHQATIDAVRLERRHATKRLAEVPFRCARCNARTIDIRVEQREHMQWFDGAGRMTRLRDFYRRGEELRMVCATCAPGREIRFTWQAIEEQMNTVNPTMRHVLARLACPTCRERGLIGAARADAPGLPARRVAVPNDR